MAFAKRIGGVLITGASIAGMAYYTRYRVSETKIKSEAECAASRQALLGPGKSRLVATLLQHAPPNFVTQLKDCQGRVVGSFVLQSLVNQTWDSDIDVAVSNPRQLEQMCGYLTTQGYKVEPIHNQGGYQGFRGTKDKKRSVDIVIGPVLQDFGFLDNWYDGEQLYVGNLDNVLTRSSKLLGNFTDAQHVWARAQRYTDRGFTILNSTNQPLTYKQVVSLA